MHFGERLRRERRRRHLSQETLSEALGCNPKTIRRWERQQAFPQAHLKLQLSRFFGIRYEEWFTENGDAIHSAPIWNIPYPRNPFFTGREEILHQLNKLLNQEPIMAQSQPWAITGPGGIGKTQIVLEYAYQHREEYRFIFWINAATRETLLTDVVTIANLLHLPERNEQDQINLIQAVKQWFATHSEWLWILDNVNDFALIRDVIPAAYSGHMLLVSRAQALGMLAQRIEVETMGIVEGMLLLLRRAKLLTPDAFLDRVAETRLAVAEAIVTEMDALPLALDQAGAYIEESGCDPSTYLDLYRTHRRELLQRRGHTPTDHPESVSTTWFHSFQKIEQSNAIAADLLCLCAFLQPDSIPEELISEGIRYFGLTGQPRDIDVFQLNAVIEELRKLSLVRRSPEMRIVQLHRLVQIVLKDTMPMDKQLHWAQRAVQATEVVFPTTIEAATWDLCRRYLPQAQACSVLIQDYALTFEKAASLLFRTATYLQEHSFYEQAEPLYHQALRIYEQILGPNHPEVARLINNLAHFFYIQHKYEQAASWTLPQMI